MVAAARQIGRIDGAFDAQRAQAAQLAHHEHHGEREAQHVGHRLRPPYAGDAHERRHDDNAGDGEQEITAHAQHRGDDHLVHGLEVGRHHVRGRAQAGQQAERQRVGGGQRDEVGLVSAEDGADGHGAQDEQRRHHGDGGGGVHQRRADERLQAIGALGAVVHASQGLHAVGGAQPHHVEDVHQVAVQDGEGAYLQIAAQHAQIVVDDDGVQKAGGLHEERGQPDGQDLLAQLALKLHVGEGDLELRVLAEDEIEHRDEPEADGQAVVHGRARNAHVRQEDGAVQPHDGQHGRSEHGGGGQPRFLVDAQHRRHHLAEDAERVEAHEDAHERDHAVHEVGRGAQHQGDLRREDEDERRDGQDEVRGKPEALAERLARARHVAGAQTVARDGGHAHAQRSAQRQVQQLERHDDAHHGQAERSQAVADDHPLEDNHDGLRGHADERDERVLDEQAVHGLRG